MTSSPATSPASARLRWREKLGYGAGDLGLNLYWANISAFLLIFYTDTMHLPAAAVGTMILLTKIADAIADPAMGALADRTRSRLGKFRPYLLWGALPMAAAGVLAYTTPDLDQHGRMWWATITFLVMMLAYTVVSIPYSALSGVIT
ncbi:MFS transporter, partial [Xanthomonas euvesicatoria]